MPWFPLAGDGTPEHDALERIAKAHHATPTQVALIWLLARSPQMLPIPGTSSIAHFDENIASADLELSVEEMKELCGRSRGGRRHVIGQNARLVATRRGPDPLYCVR